MNAILLRKRGRRSPSAIPPSPAERTVMSDKSVAGVKYTQAGAGYFEKRRLKRSAGVWGLWGLGIAAVISGDFSGWNVGPRHDRLGRHARRHAAHHGHVLHDDLLDRRDVGGHAAHRRRLLVRASRDGALGRLRHRTRRDDRVRRDDGGDRLVLRRLRGLGALGAHRESRLPAPVWWVDPLRRSSSD